MEEKKPLDTRSLTHTSKETEGQVWAQIGTSSYDPPKKEETVDSNGVEAPQAQDQKEEDDDDDDESLNAAEEGASDLELHVDVNAEPNETEEMERGVEPKAKPANKKPVINNKRTLDDGFAATDPMEEEEEIEEGKKVEEEKKEEKREERSARSRSREKIYHTTDRTNSNDPRAIRSRVFVGHLNEDKCLREDLDKIFAPFGKIVGINLQQGYGFVQYEDEENVRKAIKELHGYELHDNKIVVDRPLAYKPIYSETRRSRDRSKDRSREHGSGRDTRDRDRDMADELRRRDRDMQERYARLEEMERYYYSKERPRDYGREYDRRDYGRDYDRRDYGRDHDRRDYDNDRHYPLHPPPPPPPPPGPYERDPYRSQDRYGRDDLYERGRGGHYMGRDDPYGLPPSRHM